MRRRPHDRRALTWRGVLALFGVALVARLAVIAAFGVDRSGDYMVYDQVARNLLLGCGVSLSPAGACVPQFGGNGLPGYPAFLAVVRAVFGDGGPGADAALFPVQAVLAAAAVARLGWGVGRMAGAGLGWAAGLVAALSPLQAVMVRYGLTEALALAAADWLLAELALSFAVGRLRVLPIAAACTVGMFLRLDFVLFLLPVAIVGLRLHGVREAAYRGVVLALVLAVPLGAWSVRNAALGVPLLPLSWMLPDGSAGPRGLLAWLKQWVTTEQERAAATYFGVDEYGRMRFLPSPFRLAGQDERAGALLAQLQADAGAPFPADVDAGFAALGAEAAAARPVGRTMELWGMQGWGLWRSWAGPLRPEPPPRGDPAAVGVDAFDVMARLYRRVLGLSFLAVLLLPGGGGRVGRTFGLAAMAVVAAKTVLAAAALLIEARYTLTVVPLVELAVVLGGVLGVAGVKRSTT